MTGPETTCAAPHPDATSATAASERSSRPLSASPMMNSGITITIVSSTTASNLRPGEVKRAGLAEAVSVGTDVPFPERANDHSRSRRNVGGGVILLRRGADLFEHPPCFDRRILDRACHHDLFGAAHLAGAEIDAFLDCRRAAGAEPPAFAIRKFQDNAAAFGR